MEGLLTIKEGRKNTIKRYPIIEDAEPIIAKDNLEHALANSPKTPSEFVGIANALKPTGRWIGRQLRAGVDFTLHKGAPKWSVNLRTGHIGLRIQPSK